MDLSATTASAYLHHAFRGLLGVAERLGEPSINIRPLGPQTNSVAALVVHCCGVARYWLGHVSLATPSVRDRDAEFASTASLEELRALVGATLDDITAYVVRIDDGEGCPECDRVSLYGGDRSDAAVVLHVIEECYQHLGHAELAADVLRQSPDDLAKRAKGDQRP